jgi:hypothetical protein
LKDDATRAQGQVAHLGVPHLPVGEPHRGARRLEAPVGVPDQPLWEVLDARPGDGVARPVGGRSPAV